MNFRRTQRVYPNTPQSTAIFQKCSEKVDEHFGNGRASENAKRSQLRIRATYLSYRTTHLSRYYPTYHSLITASDPLSRPLQLRREAASILNAIPACSRLPDALHNLLPSLVGVRRPLLDDYNLYWSFDDELHSRKRRVEILDTINMPNGCSSPPSHLRLQGHRRFFGKMPLTPLGISSGKR